MHCWTDKVTKFDSSAFYNWEQDNMPVYDLEERTHYLWEKLGFPTSSIPGIALAVSADASDSDIACNKNVFRTVSAAIAALPEMINFPVLIEIANFGDLGEMVLNNFKFGPKGSLEIINRNFAKADSEASAGFAAGTLPGRIALHAGRSDNTSPNPYYYISGINTNYGVLSEVYIDLQYVFDPKIQFRDASCLSLSSRVCSGLDNSQEFNPVSDSRLSSTLNGFVSLAHAMNSTWVAIPLDTIEYNSNYTKSNLILASNNNVSLYNNAGANYADWFTFKSYDLNSDANQYISTYDVSTFDYLQNNTHLYSTRSNPFDSGYNAVFYGNRINKIIVNNCEGPIFIRNFFVDGSGYSRTNNNYGIEVNNSKNVHLENIVSTRHRKAGLVFNNSEVKLLRNCISTRNYDYDSNGTRKTGPWSSKSLYDSFSTGNYLTTFDEGAGLVANNSKITVSSVRTFQEEIERQHVYEKSVSLGAPFQITDYLPFANKNCIFEFSKNANGIILNNSTFEGGEVCKNSKGIPDNLNTIYLDIYNNIEHGIRSNNSRISFDGKLAFIENSYGIKLDSSVFEIDKACFIYNQKVGMLANNSNITYNKNLIDYVNISEDHSPLHFLQNGQHIVLNSSKLLPVMTSGMDSIYDEFFTYNPIGVKNPTLGDRELVPGIELSNNSQAVLVAPNIVRNSEHSVYLDSDTACKGSELSVLNNSKATLIGTKNRATKIIGPQNRGYQKNIAAAYAGNNSTLEFNGPTLIAQYGIDILAEEKSNININPQRLNGENTLDVSSFNLADRLNHTAVELHSTRACVVVDKQSSFNARDLGSFAYNWEFTGSYYSNRVTSGFDYGDLSSIEAYVSAGSLQFYPNPIPTYSFTAYDSNAFPGAANVTALANSFSLAANNRNLYYLKDTNTASNDYSSVTNGGMCVRALNGSLVNVHNVNFPCGWWNASSPYYDNTIAATNGGLCYKLFIWNIADNSQLKASYLSVSGLYPKAAGYVGPAGMWLSGANIPASGLPSSTPDTSSASILDYFGYAAASANPFGKTTADNYGPFRLYFSINPVANVLTNINTETYKVIPQIYSQGYQPSASLICSAFGASALYPSVLQRNSSNQIVASGYYYGNTITDTNGYVKILLDESSSETFANAKHCSVGKSNNSKLVSIYYPYTNVKVGSSYTETGVKSPNTFDLQRDN